MGLFSWLRGQNSSQDTGSRQASGPLEQFVADAGDRPMPSRMHRLSTDGRVAVVGESFYQDALLRAAGGRAAHGGFDSAIDVTAILVPEPSNPHDRWAVRVDVLMGNRVHTVGYLDREHARVYQPALRAAFPEGTPGWCPGKIMGGGGRYYGIHLWLADPDCLIFSCAEPDNAYILPAERAAALSGEEAHGEALQPFAPEPGGRTRVYAELSSCTIDKGKYAGEQTIEALICGRRVGQLTHAMGQRYVGIVREVAASGSTPVCEAVVTTGDKGPQVELRMPAV